MNLVHDSGDNGLRACMVWLWRQEAGRSHERQPHLKGREEKGMWLDWYYSCLLYSMIWHGTLWRPAYPRVARQRTRQETQESPCWWWTATLLWRPACPQAAMRWPWFYPTQAHVDDKLQYQCFMVVECSFIFQSIKLAPEDTPLSSLICVSYWSLLYRSTIRS